MDGTPVTDDNGEPLRGTTACNIPIGIGTRGFVAAYLDQRMDTITRKNNVIAQGETYVGRRGDLSMNTGYGRGGQWTDGS